MKNYLLSVLVILVITSCSTREEKVKEHITPASFTEQLTPDSVLISKLNKLPNTAICYDKFTENGIGYIIIECNDSLQVFKGTSPLFKRVYENYYINSRIK